MLLPADFTNLPEEPEVALQQESAPETCGTPEVLLSQGWLREQAQFQWEDPREGRAIAPRPHSGGATQ